MTPYRQGMSPLGLIEQTLKRTARRVRLERMWRAFWRGLLIGGCVWLAGFGIYKLLPVPIWSLYGAAIAGGVVLLAYIAVAGLRKMSLGEAARFVDARKNLKERLSTALEISAVSIDAEWKELVIADALKHSSEIDPRQLLPLRLPSVARWAAVVVIL